MEAIETRIMRPDSYRDERIKTDLLNPKNHIHSVKLTIQQ